MLLTILQNNFAPRSIALKNIYTASKWWSISPFIVPLNPSTPCIYTNSKCNTSKNELEDSFSMPFDFFFLDQSTFDIWTYRFKRLHLYLKLNWLIKSQLNTAALCHRHWQFRFNRFCRNKTMENYSISRVNCMLWVWNGRFFERK